MEPAELLDVEEPYGAMATDNSPLVAQLDQEIVKQINEATGGKVTPRVAWPTRSVKPVSEYGTDKIFCLAFPWLFPGGVGDVNDVRRKDITAGDWGSHLLYYQDGRFARDKLWCFFALNYITRHRNQSSSKFFVKGFLGKTPPTLEELHERIRNNDEDFINKLCYFSKSVPGSAGYWRGKKAELYSWINHHVEQGNGAPNLFITLSCAEYFWPDLKRLLQQHILECEGKHVDLEKDQTALNNAVVDYSIVVQEFFQIRTKEFLETIGRGVFEIKHYWCRFEFAKSRGQIHAHLLAITKDSSDKDGVFHQMHRCRNDTKKQEQILGEWAHSKLGLVASLPHCEEQGETEGTTHPCSKRLCQEQDWSMDKFNLLHRCQMHKCSDYCLRKVKTTKTATTQQGTSQDGAQVSLFLKDTGSTENHCN
jgi:Helitron helicase-like domain at N-terminus